MPLSVLNCMKQLSPKTCVSGPGSNILIFECSDEVVPLLTTNVNQSLLPGIFPSCMKSAIDVPLLKKNSFNLNVSLVSNQSFVSKLIKKIVLDQLFHHLHQNSLWHTSQSTSEPKHSTVTALLCVSVTWLLQILALSPFWLFCLSIITWKTLSVYSASFWSNQSSFCLSSHFCGWFWTVNCTNLIFLLKLSLSYLHLHFECE